MSNCFGCFKPARDPTACIACTYSTSGDVVVNTLATLPSNFQNVPPELLDEVQYELMCHLPQRKAEEARKMMQSDLAILIGKCADAALYLSKKRDQDVDDMKVILFNPEFGEAFITNADVVIRIFDLHPDILAGLDPAIPAYDYLAERFIPNPLPFSMSEMGGQFLTDPSYSVTIPVRPLLEWIHSRYPLALERRSTFTVLDCGYGVNNGAFIIPQFTEHRITHRKFFANVAFFDGRPIIVSKDSVIGESCVDTDKSYAVTVSEITDDYVAVNVYKTYSDRMTFGLYKIMGQTLADDIHPFNLEEYSDLDKLSFKIVPDASEMSAADKMSAFRSFSPLAIETEYLFHTLILMGSFGVEEVILHVRNSPDQPIVFEAARNGPPAHPGIDAIMGTIEIGEDGRRCEEILAREGH